MGGQDASGTKQYAGLASQASRGGEDICETLLRAILRECPETSRCRKASSYGMHSDSGWEVRICSVTIAGSQLVRCSADNGTTEAYFDVMFCSFLAVFRYLLKNFRLACSGRPSVFESDKQTHIWGLQTNVSPCLDKQLFSYKFVLAVFHFSDTKKNKRTLKSDILEYQLNYNLL